MYLCIFGFIKFRVNTEFTASDRWVRWLRPGRWPIACRTVLLTWQVRWCTWWVSTAIVCYNAWWKFHRWRWIHSHVRCTAEARVEISNVILRLHPDLLILQHLQKKKKRKRMIKIVWRFLRWQEIGTRIRQLLYKSIDWFWKPVGWKKLPHPWDKKQHRISLNWLCPFFDLAEWPTKT